MKGDGSKKKRKKTYSVMMFGIPYKLPITKDTAPIIALLEGSLKPWADTGCSREWSRRRLATNGMREIIRSLLHQVRDSVGADVTKHILQEIGDKLHPMVRRRVDGDMRKELAVPHKALPEGNSQKP